MRYQVFKLMSNAVLKNLTDYFRTLISFWSNFACLFFSFNSSKIENGDFIIFEICCSLLLNLNHTVHKSKIFQTYLGTWLQIVNNFSNDVGLWIPSTGSLLKYGQTNTCKQKTIYIFITLPWVFDVIFKMLDVKFHQPK